MLAFSFALTAGHAEKAPEGSRASPGVSANEATAAAGGTVAAGRRRCVSRLTWSRRGGSATTEVALRAVRELPVRKLFIASPPTARTFFLGPGHRASIEPARLFIYSRRVDKLVVSKRHRDPDMKIKVK